jgi:hypothetical protein
VIEGSARAIVGVGSNMKEWARFWEGSGLVLEAVSGDGDLGELLVSILFFYSTLLFLFVSLPYHFPLSTFQAPVPRSLLLLPSSSAFYSHVLFSIRFFEVLVRCWRSGGVFQATTARGLKPLFGFSLA